MHEVNPAAFGFSIQIAALDAALKAVLPGMTENRPSISTYGPTRPISIWLDDNATPANDATALAAAAAHDPVFLSANKAAITADGVDSATVTVTAPKPGAAAVTLSVSVNGAAPTDWPIALVAGVGSDALTSLDPATYTVSVKNPANRSADQIIIIAR